MQQRAAEVARHRRSRHLGGLPLQQQPLTEQLAVQNAADRVEREPRLMRQECQHHQDAQCLFRYPAPTVDFAAEAPDHPIR